VKNRRIREETVGLFLVLSVVPFIYLFGINAGSIVGVIMLLSVGIYWIVTKPSKKFICKECMKEKGKKNRKTLNS
jgi:hypothetical protein